MCDMSNDNTLKYYNASDLWSVDASHEQKLLLEKVFSMLPKDIESILDVGCGNGVITNQLPDNKHVCGMDISDEALKYVNRETKVGSIDKLPFGNDEFDLILSTDTIEHLPIEIYDNGLKEIQRVAKKYLLIAVPYKEDLELAKAKCSKCGCEYHINWHLRSLDIKKLIDDIGTEKFNLYSVGFSGDSWPYYCDVVDKIDRVANNNFHKWDRAICPLCGSNETVQPNNETIEAIYQLRENCFSESLKVNSNIMPTRNEMILLFKANSYDNSPFDKFEKDKLYFYIRLDSESKKLDNNVKVIQKGCYDIIVGSIYNKRTDTRKHSVHSYIVENEMINWGGIELVDNRLVRKYTKRNESRDHAIFVVPQFTKNRFNITISYKDCSETPLTVQVYDKDKSYIRLGDLESKNDQRWKTSSFTVPPGIKCLDEGYIFDLVCYNKQIEPNYYIDKILVDGSFVLENTIEELSSRAFEDDVYKYYELDINESILRDTIIHTRGLKGVKEFGILYNHVAINLDKYELASDLLETHIYKWVFYDQYFDRFNSFNIMPEIHEDIKAKVFKLFLHNLDNDIVKEACIRDFEQHKAMASIIDDKAQIVIDLINNLNSSILIKMDELKKLNCMYETAMKEHLDRIAALDKQIILSHKKIKELEDQNNQLTAELSSYGNQIKEKSYEIEKMKEVIDKLNNRNLFDFICKRG